MAIDDGNDLGKIKIERLDERPVSEVARELRALADRLRRGADVEHEKSKGPLKLLPTWLIRPMLWLTGWLTGSLGISIPQFGLEAYPFGSCIITSVGMLGLDEGFAPFTPFARVPLLVLVGAVRDGVSARDGVAVVHPELTITATIDHRFVDGFQLGKAAKVLKEVLENPWILEGMDGPPARIEG